MKKELKGIIVINKPKGLTSADVVARVKKMLRVKKLGHAGTLDPFATGVLVLCVNQATKLAAFLLKGDKKYEAVLELGIETDTQDPTGTVISRSDDTNCSESEIHAAFERFKGIIEQEPPVYSALKHEGIPLYKLARKGKPIRKPPRKIKISKLDIVGISLPEISFSVECSAGTYIRTLASDIGKILGCGGYLKELERSGSSGFSIGEALTFDDLEKLTASGRIAEKIIPMADALRDIPGRVADGILAKKIVHGQPLAEKDIRPVQTGHEEGFLKIVDRMKNLLAVVKYEKEKQMYNYCCVFPE